MSSVDLHNQLLMEMGLGSDAFSIVVNPSGRSIMLNVYHTSLTKFMFLIKLFQFYLCIIYGQMLSRSNGRSALDPQEQRGIMLFPGNLPSPLPLILELLVI